MSDGLDSALSLTPQDLRRLRIPCSPTLGYDKADCFAVVESIRDDDLGYLRSLWRFSVSGAAQEVLPDAGATYKTAELSRDGDRLAVIVTVNGRSELRVLELANDEIVAVFETDGAITSVCWSDSSDLFLCVDRLPFDERLFGSDSGMVEIDWLHYKSDGRREPYEPFSELWRVGLRGEKTRILDSSDHISCFVPSGKGVVFAVEKRHSNDVTPGGHIYSLDISSRETELLFTSQYPVDAIALTSAASKVIFISSISINGMPRIPRLQLLESAGNARALFQDSDLDCEYAVLGDSGASGKQRFLSCVDGSDEIVFVVTIDGDAALFIGDPLGGGLRRLSPKGWSVSDFSSVEDGKLIACMESFAMPMEIYELSLDGSPSFAPAMSSLNSGLLREFAFTGPESMFAIAPDGTEIGAFLYRPLKSTESPLLVKVHGGPHLCYGSRFDFEVQLQLSEGYSILMPNISGSAGLGSEFRGLTVGQWGGRDFLDLMLIVDTALKNFGFDEDQIFIQGGSYGGYLVNWALTSTSRFKAAVSERSLSNLISKYGTSDNGVNVSKLEMGGADLFDESLNVLIEKSPLFRAPKVTTPILLIHGESDYRVPIEQSEQFFLALKRLHKEVVFVRVKDESHGFHSSGRPDRRIGRLALIQSWFRKFK